MPRKYASQAISAWLNDYNTLQGLISSNEQELSVQEAEYARVKAQIEAIDLQIRPFDLKITAIQSQIQKLNNLQTIDDLEKIYISDYQISIHRLEPQLASLKSKIAGLAQDITNWSNLVGMKEAQSFIAVNNYRLNKLRDSASELGTELGTVKGRLAIIQSNIQGLNSQISSLETAQQFDQMGHSFQYANNNNFVHHGHHGHHGHHNNHNPYLLTSIAQVGGAVMHAVNDMNRDSQLQSMRTALRQAHQQEVILATSVGSLQAQYTPLHNEYSLLSADMGAKKDFLDKFKPSEKALAVSTDETAARAALAHSQQEQQTLMQQQTILNTQLLTCRRKLQEARDKIKRLTADNNDLEKAAGTEYSAEKDITKLQSKLGMIEEGKAPLSTHRSSVALILFPLQNQIGGLQDVINNLRRKKSTCENDKFLFPFCRDPKKIIAGFDCRIKRSNRNIQHRAPSGSKHVRADLPA